MNGAEVAKKPLAAHRSCLLAPANADISILLESPRKSFSPAMVSSRDPTLIVVIGFPGCHWAGLGHSPKLAASCQTVTIALHVDPRWA
ncbi:MAG: hypothetical protein QOF84_1228 [Streptomyces sp.]|jgi:hypothetical protein|nr:hypothetical protein [Streptomyces sp.]